MSAEAVFVPENGHLGATGRFVGTELARGPWDPQAQHGGAPAALLMRAFERLPAADGLMLARVTYELVRPVALGELELSAAVIRPGKRVQLLEGSITATDGTALVRARALQVRRAETASSGPGDAGALRAPGGAGPLPPGPERGRENDMVPPHRPMFAPDAIELRFVAGTFSELGPATAWFRLRRPLVCGEDATPLQRLAAAGDFGNGISAILSWDDHVFINPDLTLYIEREPVGDWICLQSETRIAPGGVGVSDSVVYDERGRVGRAIQSLLVARR